jgi:hypothetical protein
MLEEANHFHPNIKLVRQLGTTVSFLDVNIENKNGTLAVAAHQHHQGHPLRSLKKIWGSNKNLLRP